MGFFHSRHAPLAIAWIFPNISCILTIFDTCSAETRRPFAVAVDVEYRGLTSVEVASAKTAGVVGLYCLWDRWVSPEKIVDVIRIVTVEIIR